MIIKKLCNKTTFKKWFYYKEDLCLKGKMHKLKNKECKKGGIDSKNLKINYD